jgi:small-conductance mechanosensitive channel
VRVVSAYLERKYKTRIQGLQDRSRRIVRADQIWRALSGILDGVCIAAMVVTALLWLHYILSLFPWTRPAARSLFVITIDPLRTLGSGLLGAIPKLVFLATLALVTHGTLKLLRVIFNHMARGAITLSGFESEWAWPTYRLIRVLVVALAAVVAYPYIPGSDTGAFKGVSLFMGVVFSLGSSSLIGNLIAGYSMVYRRAFRIGDRVRIGQHIGDVQQVRVLVTHLRTPKNEEVVVPNSTILTTEVVNYSSLARQRGLILHTTVGIGYETPWRQVEAMLLMAAARSPGLRREPPPFVLQTALGDFCITYEINVYCDTPETMPELYAEMHRNILDIFNEYGVQIMTPAYERDPAQPKVVPMDQWYAAPAHAPESQEKLLSRTSGEQLLRHNKQDTGRTQSIGTP